MKRSSCLVRLFLVGAILFVPATVLANVASTQVPAWLTGTWNERIYPGYEPDRLNITADGIYAHEITREMGQYGTYIPYPTPCRHLEVGRIEYLGAPSKATVERFKRTKRQPPAYTMLVRIQKVELIPSKHNGAYCPDWLEDAKGRVERGESSHEWHFSAPSASVLFESWREIEFVRADR